MARWEWRNSTHSTGSGPNVSFGLGYTEVKAHLASVKTDNSGLFDFNTKGPEFFVRVAF